jgi:hypothetical protein
MAARPLLGRNGPLNDVAGTRRDGGHALRPRGLAIA